MTIAPNRLLAELKATAWTCASINAAVAAQHPPRLYRRAAKPKATTYEIAGVEVKEEITKHPAIDLLEFVTDGMNAYELWELTTLQQEAIGTAVWWVEHLHGTPVAIWIAPPGSLTWQNPENAFSPPRISINGEPLNPAQTIIHKYPDPQNPYGPGSSPLQAIFTEAKQASAYARMKLAKFENRARPDMVVSPTEIQSEAETIRMERRFTERFAGAGQGRALFTDAPIDLKMIEGSMGDLAALAEKGKNNEDIANAFAVPLSMLSTNTNLANLQASQAQHLQLAIRPRLRRRDQKLNEAFLPMYPDYKELVFISDPPQDADAEKQWRIFEYTAKYGILTINELRASQGYPPVPWGNKPCATPQEHQNNATPQSTKQQPNGKKIAATE